MAKSKTIPETTDAEAIVSEARSIVKEIQRVRLSLEDHKDHVKATREELDELVEQLVAIHADENRPLLAMAEESDG